jgi:hypothetical protein
VGTALIGSEFSLLRLCVAALLTKAYPRLSDSREIFHGTLLETRARETAGSVVARSDDRWHRAVAKASF